MTSCLDDPKLVRIVVAALVAKLGGSVTITQADIDDVAFNRVIEEGYSTKIVFTLERRSAVG